MRISATSGDGCVHSTLDFINLLCFFHCARPIPERRVLIINSPQRGRVYLLSDEPVDTPLMGREYLGCNCYSSGEPSYTECIMPKAHSSILAFFSLAANVPGYAEIEAPETLVDSGRDSRSRLTEILEQAQWRGAHVEEV